jgi:hypothetical protein
LQAIFQHNVSPGIIAAKVRDSLLKSKQIGGGQLMQALATFVRQLLRFNQAVLCFE